MKDTISACNAARERNSPIKAREINPQRSCIDYQPDSVGDVSCFGFPVGTAPIGAGYSALVVWGPMTATPDVAVGAPGAVAVTVAAVAGASCRGFAAAPRCDATGSPREFRVADQTNAFPARTIRPSDAKPFNEGDWQH